MSASSSIYSGGVTTLEELADKYQRLLQEFSKTKAQHAILKKAVQNEQINNAKLLDELKTKELELRQQSQELDNLNFHNVGLTRKVSSLQTSSTKGAGLNWLSNSSKKVIQDLQVQLDAATLDLQNKIQENENLYRELDENQTSNSLSLTEVKHINQELELNIKKLQEKYELSEKQHTDSMNTILQQKEAIETEIKQVVSTLESLQPKTDTSSVLISSQDVDNLFDIQAAIRSEAKLVTNFHTINPKMDSCSQILKELTDKTILASVIDGIEKLSQCIKLIQEVTEKRNAHLTATLKVDMSKLSQKAKDCYRKIEFCLNQIRTHLTSLGNSATFWVSTIPPNLASFKPLHEILNTLVQLLSTSLAQLRLETKSEPQDVLMDQFLAATQACSLAFQTPLTRDSFKVIHGFHRTLIQTLTLVQKKLNQQSQTSEYLLQTMNAQLIGLFISLHLNIDPLFNHLNRWLLLALAVDPKTYDSLSRHRPNSQVTKLEHRSDKFVRNLRRQLAPTSIPYTESLHLLTANMNHKEEKMDFIAKLDQEKELTRRKDHLIQKFQAQLTTAESKSNEAQLRLQEIETKYQQTIQELETLKLAKVKETEMKTEKEAINGSNFSLRNGNKPSTLPSTAISTPVTTNGTHEDKFNTLTPTVAFFADSAESSDPKLPPIVNGTFTNYLSNEEHYVEKLFKNRYETKLRSLTEQAELKDSQLTRLLALTQQQHQLIIEKERERREALETNVQLQKELEASKGREANGQADLINLDS